MSDLTPNQWTILESLRQGAVWARSLQPVKPLLNDLIARRLIERCRPPLSRGANMVRLTPIGCELLEIEMSSVPAFRQEPLNLCNPQKRPRYKRQDSGTNKFLGEIPAPIPNRDPCPRCGVRGDIGCGHSKAPLSMGI